MFRSTLERLQRSRAYLGGSTFGSRDSRSTGRRGHALIKALGAVDERLRRDKATAGPRTRGCVAFGGNSIRVICANPDVMLAMKVAALRTSDHPDIGWLAEHLGLSDPDEIIELTERVLRDPLNEDKRLRLRTMFSVSSPS